MKTARLVIGGVVLLASAMLMTGGYQQMRMARLNSQVEQLQQEKQQLLLFMQRLAVSRRVAQVDVVKQYFSPQGHLISALLWQEIGSDGTLGVPQALEVTGNLVYFEAATIKFPHQFVAEADPQRGSTLVLFRRVFGDRQASADVPLIDNAARPFMARQDSTVEFEQHLWDRFWELVESPALAAEYEIRIAQIEAPAVPLRTGQVWEVAVDAGGGLNLRQLGARAPVANPANAAPRKP